MTEADAWEQFMKLHKIATTAMDDRLEAEFGHGLDHYDVLHRLAATRTATSMGDLAARLLVANSSCNRVVGQLVDEGHVVRSRDQADGRIVLVGLTARGRRLHRNMAARHTRHIEQLLGGLSPTRQARFRADVAQILESRSEWG